MEGALLVADQINSAPMLDDAHSMVLHARTPPNITQHENLDVVIPCIDGWSVAGWGEHEDEKRGNPDEKQNEDLQCQVVEEPHLGFVETRFAAMVAFGLSVCARHFDQTGSLERCEM